MAALRDFKEFYAFILSYTNEATFALNLWLLRLKVLHAIFDCAAHPLCDVGLVEFHIFYLICIHLFICKRFYLLAAPMHICSSLQET